jgi:hypothetical protein
MERRGRYQDLRVTPSEISQSSKYLAAAKEKLVKDSVSPV